MPHDFVTLDVDQAGGFNVGVAEDLRELDYLIFRAGNVNAREGDSTVLDEVGGDTEGNCLNVIGESTGEPKVSSGRG
jgi:hypothetical protein